MVLEKVMYGKWYCAKWFIINIFFLITMNITKCKSMSNPIVQPKEHLVGCTGFWRLIQLTTTALL